MAYKPPAGNITSSPNVVPMADIMLVLLIIFMVITPMLQKGVSVDMAKAENTMDLPNADKDDAVLLAITRDGSIYLGNNKIAFDLITTTVKDRLANRPDKTVFVRSDARAKYGDVVRVVDEVRSAGVDNVGLLTQKLETKKKPGVPQASPGGGIGD
jgi:biopolymer transport protein ExbD/biopolymer transport protein TolR